ncbi:MAG: type II toxin-antitoxin system VapC family toxin [archaeon]
MGPPVCLDTDVIIEFLKGRNPELRKSFQEGKEYCTTSITAFELRMRKTNLKPVEEFLARTKVFSFDDLCSAIAADTNKELKERGKTIELRDLFIAATCIRNNCALLTKNQKHFRQMKGLELA